MDNGGGFSLFPPLQAGDTPSTWHQPPAPAPPETMCRPSPAQLFILSSALTGGEEQAYTTAHPPRPSIQAAVRFPELEGSVAPFPPAGPVQRRVRGPLPTPRASNEGPSLRRREAAPPPPRFKSPPAA